VKVVDLYTALSNRADLFPDKIHPNEQGAKLMAKEIYKALAGKEYSPVNINVRAEAVWSN
ncbi:MAG: hypothetical protein KAS23_17100, partial [Anaerohalosphaera sp.]|nr:hypothetical protein [Anaerohalosphaera sp.]